MTAAMVPHNEEAEASVLGAVLLTDKAMAPVLVEAALTADDFYRPKHKAIFKAMTDLYDEDKAIDTTTIAAALERGKARVTSEYLHSLPTVVPAVGAVLDYARVVTDLAVLRRKIDAARSIERAAMSQDKDALAEAEGLLAGAQPRSADSAGPDAVAEELWEFLQQDAIPVYPWPWERLNFLTAGGMKPGQVTLIGGWSSHGKSAFLDQALEHNAVHRKGKIKQHLYINEMTRLERGLRWLAKEAHVDFAKLAQIKLTDRDRQAVRDTIGRFPFGITEAVGWSAEEIAWDIRRRRWDIAAVDILHLIEHDEEKDLARISRALNRAAKLANCHVIATVHLNENRIKSAVRPRPTLGDIRGSGSLKNDADNVLFVYRDQSKDGTVIESSGSIYFAKIRNGQLGGVPTHFNGSKMTFIPKEGS